MKAHAALIAGAAVAAGLVHAIAGGHLAAVDPIAALLGDNGGGAGFALAAVGVGAARLFLYCVAPAWAACFVVAAIARAIAIARSR